MQSFVQYTPTKVVFGKDTQKEAGKLVSELGITKVFLVYGGGSVIRSGLLDEIKKFKHVLNDEHFHYPYDCPSCIAYISFIIMKLHLYDKEKKLEDISFKNRLDDIICTINPKRFKAIKLANNNITI